MPPISLYAQQTFSSAQTAWAYILPTFSEESYQTAVDTLIFEYEKTSNNFITPNKSGKVAIKVSTTYGSGLCTPKLLTKAVINFLEKKGYERKNILIFDEREYDLRRAGYLPPLSIFRRENTFEGATVIGYDKNKPWDTNWFYSSPLPSKEKMLALADRGIYVYASLSEDRKSFLPTTLLFDVDFWINLPVVTSSRTVEIRGALTNATLSNVSNNSRFWDNPHHANIAIAEIAAIPELQESLAFTILSLERYQFIGGPIFNAYYSGSEPVLWLSKNPVALDFAMIEKINRHRTYYNLPLISTEPKFLQFAKQLGVGNYENISWINVD